MVLVVPGLDFPGLDPGFTSWQGFDETQFDDSVGGNVEAGALNVEEEQRPRQVEFHGGRLSEH